MIGSGHPDFYLETGLRHSPDSTMLIDVIIRRLVNQKSFVALVPKLVQNTVHAQVQVGIIQARCQEAVRELRDDSKLEPVEIP